MRSRTKLQKRFMRLARMKKNWQRPATAKDVVAEVRRYFLHSARVRVGAACRLRMEAMVLAQHGDSRWRRPLLQRFGVDRDAVRHGSPALQHSSAVE